MTPRCIYITGERLRAAITGALVARFCVGDGYEVVIAPADMRDAKALIMRPDVHRFHDELELSPDALAKLRDAHAVFAVTVNISNDTHLLPFAPFGQAMAGIDFHQLWLLADGIEAQPDLDSFSPSIALAKLPMTIGLNQADQLPLVSGLSAPCAPYAELLLRRAEEAGAVIVEPNHPVDPDLTIACSPDPVGDLSATFWEGAQISIGTVNGVPGMEWQHLYNSAKRAVALAVGSPDSSTPRKEFNRLASAEAERIDDFEELLSLRDISHATRSGLKRKLAVFKACGRIPMEDFEVFAQHEWLAALWGQGLRPDRVDRRANSIPQEQLLSFLENVRQRVANIENEGAAL